MDPVTLAFIASALGSGLITAITKLLEKGVVDPALEKGLEPLTELLTRGYDQKKDETRLRKAIEIAMVKTTGAKTSNDWAAYRWVTALAAIKENSPLASRVAAATLELVDLTHSISLPPDLLTELKIEDQRDDFARFLHTLRAELVNVEGYGEGIRYANVMNGNDRLRGLYELVASLSSPTYAGQALWVQPVPPDTQKLERPYLEYVKNLWGRLSLEGRSKDEAVAGRTDEGVRLEQVYIALNTTQNRQVEIKGRVANLKSITLSKSGPVEGQQTISALSAVSESRQLVILGDPGSGKSTLARHLCLCLAGARLGEAAYLKQLAAHDLEQWPLPAYFPIFVRLRDFAADPHCLPADTHQVGQAKHLFKFIRQEIDAQGWADLTNHVQALLESGQALVVLDGLDEVSHPQRQARPDNMPQADDERRVQVSQAIGDFADIRFQRARVLVTCRVRQYIDAGRKAFAWYLPGLPVFTLADFNRDQIKTFITSWFAATRLAKADEKRDTLLSALGLRPELAELAPKPILLTQMALVHGFRELPKSRIEVYRQCADLLLWDWERLRSLQGGQLGQTADDFLNGLNVAGLRREKIESALYEAVFTAHVEGKPEIPEEILRDHLTRAVMAYDLSKPRALGPAQEIIDEWLRGRNGLFIPARGDTFDLPHRSFREYMTAVVLVEKGYRYPTTLTEEGVDWDEMGPTLVGDNPATWREVFRFAASLARIKDVASALERLWPEPDDPLTQRRKQAGNLLLTAEVVRDVDPANFRDPSNRKRRELYDRITKDLMHLMRDTSGDHYPNDAPNDPPTPVETISPQTRLEAGLLLDSLNWTPPDLHNFISVPDPSHTPQPLFYIAKFPVTVGQYARFINSADYADESLWRSVQGFEAEGQPQVGLGQQAWDWFKQNGKETRRPAFWDDPRFGPPRRLLPVVGVTWWEAAAYCVWLTRDWTKHDETRLALNQIYGGQFAVRLLREEEWVVAAGGAEADRFPWGASEDDIRTHANTSESNLDRTSPVCMYPSGASPLGVLDMGGNVWEWQANLYEKGSVPRALRGGSFTDDEPYARVAARYRYRPFNTWNWAALRVGVFPG